MTDSLTATIDDHLNNYRKSLFKLLSQPSISTTGEGVDAAADLVVDTLEGYGLDARRIETSRHPVVYAEREPHSTDAPTILFYGHYDVQPPGDPDGWESPAFQPTIRDGSIYARGAGDNKGQFACHAFAVDALQQAGEFPDVHVKFLIEGGEESGSDGLREYLNESPAELDDVDLVYVADGPQHAVADEDGTRHGRPTVVYGNRGILSAQLDIQTANTDLHSGNFGGPIPAATNELVRALTSMRGEYGDEIVVKGFHQGIEITESDRALIRAIPDDAAAIAEELDVASFSGEEPYYERLLTKPTITINGLTGGYQRDGMKTVLPAKASAKIDCRLVPYQEADEVFGAIEAHLNDVAPRVVVTKQSTFPPMKTPVDTPAADPVIGALDAVWNDPPIELPLLGGSLPAAYFREVDALTTVPILIIPYANHDQGNHSPNEHIDIDRFEKGVRTSARVIQRFEDHTESGFER